MPDTIKLHAPGGVVIEVPAGDHEEGPGPSDDPCAWCGQLDVLSDYSGQMLCNWCHSRSVIEDQREDPQGFA